MLQFLYFFDLKDNNNKNFTAKCDQHDKHVEIQSDWSLLFTLTFDRCFFFALHLLAGPQEIIFV